MSLRKLFYIYLLLFIKNAFFPHTTIKSVQVANLDVEICLDYLIHVCLYLPFMFLIKIGVDCQLWISFKIGLIIAVVLEGVQMFLSYCTFNISNILANIIGLLLWPIFLQRILKLKFVRCLVKENSI